MRLIGDLQEPSFSGHTSTLGDLLWDQFTAMVGYASSGPFPMYFDYPATVSEAALLGVVVPDVNSGFSPHNGPQRPHTNSC